MIMISNFILEYYIADFLCPGFLLDIATYNGNLVIMGILHRFINQNATIWCSSFPNDHYNNARTVQFVLVSNDLGGATSQSDSLLSHILSCACLKQQDN